MCGHKRRVEQNHMGSTTFRAVALVYKTQKRSTGIWSSNFVHQIHASQNCAPQTTLNPNSDSCLDFLTGVFLFSYFMLVLAGEVSLFWGNKEYEIRCGRSDFTRCLTDMAIALVVPCVVNSSLFQTRQWVPRKLLWRESFLLFLPKS